VSIGAMLTGFFKPRGQSRQRCTSLGLCRTIFVVRSRGQFRDICRRYLTLKDQFRQDLARSRTLCDSPARVSVRQSRYSMTTVSLTQIQCIHLQHLGPSRQTAVHDRPWVGSMPALLSSRRFRARIPVIGFSLGGEVVRLL
jgi:hypothetical protein